MTGHTNSVIGLTLGGNVMLGKSKIVGFVPIKNKERAKAFYQDALGLKFVSDDQFALVFNANGNMLRLVSVPDYQPVQFTILGWDVTEIEEMVKGLHAKGVEFQRYPWAKQDELGIWTAPGGTRVAWLKDPDGNILSVSQHPA
jgi:catechol 2,3-dioxygenase-like lactoylglutathione lyase family enzyme